MKPPSTKVTKWILGVGIVANSLAVGLEVGAYLKGHNPTYLVAVPVSGAFLTWGIYDWRRLTRAEGEYQPTMCSECGANPAQIRGKMYLGKHRGPAGAIERFLTFTLRRSAPYCNPCFNQQVNLARYASHK